MPAPKTAHDVDPALVLLRERLQRRLGLPQDVAEFHLGLRGILAAMRYAKRHNEPVPRFRSNSR